MVFFLRESMGFFRVRSKIGTKETRVLEIARFPETENSDPLRCISTEYLARQKHPTVRRGYNDLFSCQVRVIGFQVEWMTGNFREVWENNKIFTMFIDSTFWFYLRMESFIPNARLHPEETQPMLLVAGLRDRQTSQKHQHFLEFVF